MGGTPPRRELALHPSRPTGCDHCPHRTDGETGVTSPEQIMRQIGEQDPPGPTGLRSPLLSTRSLPGVMGAAGKSKA